MWKMILAVTALLCGSCAANVPQQKDKAFAFAVEAVQDEAYAKGAKAAFAFISAADPDDPRYDRGLRLLARSIEALDLRWSASMLYRQIAQARRNVELVPEALRGIERVIDTGVFDEDALITSFLATEEFGELPADIQAFVDYYQGRDLVGRDRDTWAEERFKAIPPSSQYAAAAEYVRIVRLIADGAYGNAVDRLLVLTKQQNLSTKLRQDVERALARIAFEEERYEDALSHFAKLQVLAPDDPEIILETAWTYYYLGDSRKTLGLLIAMDAPVHQTYISPERYLLEALALRRLCQFGSARQAAVRLERKYATSFAAIRVGKLPKEIPEMLKAARRRGLSRANSRFLESLKAEKIAVLDMERALGPKLLKYLENLYNRGIEEAMRREEELIASDLAGLAEELLSAQEGVRLIVHELGVALLRGRRRPSGATERAAVDIPLTGDRVFYPFGDEYWTDELKDLVVIAEDRCID